MKVAAKRIAWPIVIALCLHMGFPGLAQSESENALQVKELNFVFLHGAGGYSCSMQLLADYIMEQLPAHIQGYEDAHPGTKLQVNMLLRCYPNDVDIDTWADNITRSIDKYFKDKRNLILIGHSMGGKTALYATAQNIGGLADKVALVVTINSPIKPLNAYYVTGGGSAVDYCRARWLLSDRGVCNSISYYDSSQDGRWVSRNKHWLAFISSEPAPLSEQLDFGGFDPFPRDMDDVIIPISAQYSDDADIIYYGERGHSYFSTTNEVSGFLSGQILHYIFGGPIKCSVPVREDIFEHKADWLLGTDYWEDSVGEVSADSGTISHSNESYLKWQVWEDVVGEYPSEDERSSYQTSLKSLPLLTTIEEVRWLNPENASDHRLYLRTRAAPRTTVRVEWSIQRKGLLPVEMERDHYEVRIITGTPFANIRQVSWASDDPRDLRLQVESDADSPFRWFKAVWNVYRKEIRVRKVIDEIPGVAESAGS
ncbi:alpha/beta fold hydrolase [Chloroflexota bacterium]